jgi:GrpB-like predicted nucleotidyltransferase (UPF0157 family)
MFEEVESVVGRYELRPLACEDYDPRAADVARHVAYLVSPHIGSVRVEHVGSTAVPGCAGKGIVDLMIAAGKDEMDRVKALLDRLGFQPQPGPDPFPEDRPMRVGAWDHDGETFLIHVHVIPADSPEVDEMRFFRTCLRADPELARAYMARKRQILKAGVTDRLEYVRQKGEFIQEVLG